MKKVQIHRSNHPFDPCPFEAFWNGSWQPVERLKINGGAIFTHILENGNIIEEDLPMSHLRVRSRRAVVSDCISFLRQGVDITVFSTFHDPEDSDDETSDEPVWMDAKIRSIERKHDGVTCNCEFHISFYVDQGPDLYLINKKLSKATTMVKIDQISVLQKLELKAYENQYYRWGSSEDCFSVQKFKLFCGLFCADLSWLIVASVLKQTSFDVRSLNNHIVYEVSEFNPDRGQSDSPNQMYCLNFKLENNVLTPFIMQADQGTSEDEVEFLNSYDLSELRRSKRRNVQPERYLGYDNIPDYEVEVTRLGESKTYKTECDEISSEEEEEEEEYDDQPLALSVQDDNLYQKRRPDGNDTSSSKRKLKGSTDMDSDASKHKSGKKSSLSKYLKKILLEIDASPKQFRN